MGPPGGIEDLLMDRHRAMYRETQLRVSDLLDQELATTRV